MTDGSTGTLNAAEAYLEHVAPLTNQFFPSFLKQASLQPGERILDLACGPGDLTLEAAAKAGPQGEVLGIDSSPEMIELARRRALDAGVTNVRFEVMDAQRLDLRDLYWDVAICHLGVTEFVDPAAALKQVYRVLRPVGRTCFSTWGTTGRSPWLAIPLDAAHAVVPSRPSAAKAQPFRYGEPGVLSNMLAEAEFGDVTPDRTTASLEYADPEDYWAALRQGLAATVKPLNGLTEEQLASIREAAEPTLRRWRHPRTKELRLGAEVFIGVACK